MKIAKPKRRGLIELMRQKMIQDKKTSALVVLLIRNILFFFIIAEGHHYNMGNRKFWKDFVCDSTNGDGNLFSLFFGTFCFVLDIISTKFMMVVAQKVFHLLPSFMGLMCTTVITADVSQGLHIIISVIALYLPILQIVYLMYKKNKYKNRSLICILLGYIGSIPGWKYCEIKYCVVLEWMMVILGMISQNCIIFFSEPTEENDNIFKYKIDEIEPLYSFS